MPPRKKRIVVVLDTNVVVGFYLSRNQASPNTQVFRLRRDRRKLQLILSSEPTTEYLEVLPRLEQAAEKVDDTQYSGAIPPTQLVVRSYSAYTGHWAAVPNPTNAVGGSFISNLPLISRKVNPSGELGWV